MAYAFKIKLPVNWDDRWPEVQAAANKYNFAIHKKGDEIAFNGYGIMGNIEISGVTAHVTIDRKPFFLTKSLIEEKVRDFLIRQK